jgi:predicted PurR-regulated permease PerM
VQPQHLYKAIGLFFVLALLFHFFSEIAQTLLLVYGAAILAVALNPITRRIPLQRGWVAGLVGLLVLASVGLVLWLGVPALMGQLRGLADQASAFQQRFDQWGEWLRQQTGLNVHLVGEQTTRQLQQALGGIGTEQIFGRARGLLEIILVPLIILVGGLYALAKPNDRLLVPLLRVVPAGSRPAYVRMLRLLGERLFGWIRGTLLAMLAVGLLSTLALWLIGVPYWLLLGLIIGIVEFIPLAGPWIGGIPAVAIAFFDDPTKGLWTAVAILAIQQIESNLITPWAMSTAAKIHPLVTLFALILFGSIFGFLGILLAVPLVILFWTLVEVLWVEETLDTERDPIPDVVRE